MNSTSAAFTRDWGPALIREFRRVPPHRDRWQLANALASTADASVLDDVIKLAQDTSCGNDRLAARRNLLRVRQDIRNLPQLRLWEVSDDVPLVVELRAAS